MSDIIKLLPESLANQIAAGEVVQRPASVVKELLENALDASATDIILIIKDAGKILIQVNDNGTGMSETDARMSFERHATSKITKTEDLFNIRTMGFRGEALASIAAVSQVELRSKTEHGDVGICIKIEGSQFKESSLISCSKGTSICVKNLFFNIPARKNFLKSNSIEFNHILEEFTRVALSHPEVSFSFYNNEEEVFILNSTKLSQRIVSLLGNNLKAIIAPCKEETPLISINGYIGKPEAAKKKRGDQFFFVNKRYVRHPYLHHAVNSAYEKMLEEDSVPFYVLFLEIDPIHIDINIHPTKTEIKFDDERTVYGILNSAVRKAISTFNLTTDLDFNENVNHNIFNYKRNYEQSKGSNPSESLESNNRSNWQTLYKGMERETEMTNTSTENTLELRFKSDMNATDVEVKEKISRPDVFEIFQIHNSYIITQVKSGLMIIDQQAAHERILYDKFISTLENKFGASQQFLFPLTLTLSAADFMLVHDLNEEIHSLGFSFSVFSNNTIVINGIPSDVRSGNEKALFEGFLEQFKQNKKDLRIEDRENIARSLAKRSAIKKGTKLDPQEVSLLVEQLLSSKNPSFSPDGNSTIKMLNFEKLEALFL